MGTIPVRPISPELDSPMFEAFSSCDLADVENVIKGVSFDGVDIKIADKNISFSVSSISSFDIFKILKTLIPRHCSPFFSLSLNDSVLCFEFMYMDVDNLCVFFNQKYSNSLLDNNSNNSDFDDLFSDDFAMNLNDVYNSVIDSVIAILAKYSNLNSDLFLTFLAYHLEFVFIESEIKNLNNDFLKKKHFYTIHFVKFSECMSRRSILTDRQRSLGSEILKIYEKITKDLSIMPSFDTDIRKIAEDFSFYSTFLFENGYSDPFPNKSEK